MPVYFAENSMAGLMDYRELVDEITRLVILEIEKASRNVLVSSGKPDPGSLLFLMDPEMDEFGQFFDVLARSFPQGTSHRLVAPQALSVRIRDVAGVVPCTILEDPPRTDYRAIAAGAGRVVVPHLSVTSLSKMANLIGDELLPGIGTHALLLGRPVMVCTDFLHSLNFSDTATSRKILSSLRGSLSTLQEMGAVPFQMKSFREALLEKALPAEQGPVKNVVTNEDVLVAAAQKKTRLNFPRGTIITPLARETAAQNNIEINLA